MAGSAATARQALAEWDLPDARLTVAARRENEVWRVESEAGTHALRLHRPGLRSPEEIGSELDFMAVLAASGLSVPAPLPSRQGSFWIERDGILVSVLHWVPGQALTAATPTAERTAAYRELGGAMARMHRVADGWQPGRTFTRPSWDKDGLVGDSPLWGRYLDHPGLSADDRALLRRATEAARRPLPAWSTDFGLIHADLVVENVLFDAGHPWLIDFDDFGYGYRLFDLATVILRAEREPDFDRSREALLDGYLAERSLDLEALDLFVMLRSFTYVGWIMSRPGEPGATERSARFLARATRHAHRMLD